MLTISVRLERGFIKYMILRDTITSNSYGNNWWWSNYIAGICPPHLLENK